MISGIDMRDMADTAPTADDLHDAGSAIEAAVAMGNPGTPIKMDPRHLARLLMGAAARIRELEKQP